MDVDLFDERGPGLGQDVDYAGKDLLDIPSKYVGLIKAYGMIDNGTDILARPRRPA